MSMPQMCTLPAVLFTSPARMWMMVELPAPLGPRRPNIEPRGIARSMPLMAVFSGVSLVLG